jgi:hypothetical protein
MARKNLEGGTMRYYGKNLRNLEFVVIKHKLKGLETELLGIRYREGYAVIAKNTKVYHELKKIRNAIDAEFPITHLGKLACVINDKQIQYIWGKAVYDYYLKKKFEVQNTPEIVKKLAEAPECEHIKEDGQKCLSKAIKGASLCIHHIRFDERVKDDFEKMPVMPKKEKKALIQKLIKEKIRES